MSIHNIHSVGVQCTTVDLHHLLSVGVTHSHTAQINLKPKASKPSFKKICSTSSRSTGQSLVCFHKNTLCLQGKAHTQKLLHKNKKCAYVTVLLSKHWRACTLLHLRVNLSSLEFWIKQFIARTIFPSPVKLCKCKYCLCSFFFNCRLSALKQLLLMHVDL